uniref:Uncharacterized protein n=1 Tax=Poecilia latipinna TaxID=48699 RepID=A0A3B3VIE4_9TELE
LQETKKIIGNKFASTGDYSMAVKYFTDAIKYNPKEFKLFGNRSFCFEKMQEYEKALTDAELALSVSPGWVKGLFRKGKALAGLKVKRSYWKYTHTNMTLISVMSFVMVCDSSG